MLAYGIRPAPVCGARCGLTQDGQAAGFEGATLGTSRRMYAASPTFRRQAERKEDDRSTGPLSPPFA